MSIIKAGKSGNKMGLTVAQVEELEKMYSQAVKGTKAFGYTAPGHYDYESLKANYANGKLYRPLVSKFNLV